MARHVYVRQDGEGIAARCRNRFEIMEAVKEGANAGLVLTVLEGAPTLYDVPKSEDDTIHRLLALYPSARITKNDYLSFEDANENDKFRKTWENIY
jgi:hypothetical protein